MAFAEKTADVDLDAFLQPLHVDLQRLTQLSHEWALLYDELAKTSVDQFLPTPVSSLASGRETGKFLAIDVGGTNLRVGFVELLGEYAQPNKELDGPTDVEKEPVESCNGEHAISTRLRRSHERAWPIGEHLKMDKAEDLFAWIGDCIAEVVSADLEASKHVDTSFHIEHDILMGITFSFPMLQTSLAEATLMPMGKGFAITSDLNLGKLLLAGYEKYTHPASATSCSTNGIGNPVSKLGQLPRIKIAAISNDTVATLAATSYVVQASASSRVAMGLIVGTGTNATIPMRLNRIGREKREQISYPDTASLDELKVVVNTEWTINGTAAPLGDLDFVTKWDQELDRASEAPGFQPFETMTAGRYLGELARLIALDVFTQHFHVQVECLPLPLRERNAFSTTVLAGIVLARTSSESLIAYLMETLLPPNEQTWCWTKQTAEVMDMIERLLRGRSAGLIAAAVLGLLGCNGDIDLNERAAKAQHSTAEELVVASTGGMITHYPSFVQTLQTSIDELLEHTHPLNEGRRIVLQEALDGGVIGAGVLAGTAGALK